MENITLFSLFIIGLSYGATACMFSCMPFLAPLLLSNSRNLKEAVKIVLPFSLGRIFTYTIIAMVALSSSVLIKSILNDNTIFQIILGFFTILMGLFLLFRVIKKEKSSCSTQTNTTQPKGVVGLFIIGAMVSLNPCAPILTLITLSANSSTLTNAILFGVSFGVGAVLVPFMFYTFFVSNIIRGLLEQFRNYVKFVEYFAAFLLIGVGVLVMFGKVSL